MVVAALPLRSPGLEIDQICAGAPALTVSVTLLLPTSTCLLCGMSATYGRAGFPLLRQRVLYAF